MDFGNLTDLLKDLWDSFKELPTKTKIVAFAIIVLFVFAVFVVIPGFWGDDPLITQMHDRNKYKPGGIGIITVEVRNRYPKREITVRSIRVIFEWGVMNETFNKMVDPGSNSTFKVPFRVEETTYGYSKYTVFVDYSQSVFYSWGSENKICGPIKDSIYISD